MTAQDSTAINDASKKVLTPAEQLAQQRAEVAHRILLENGGGPVKKFTADELMNRETATRAKVAQAVQSFDPANPVESMRKFTQFSTTLAQQDNQFRSDIGPKPTAPTLASAHAEGYLMRTEANYAANVYIKMAQYLHDHQDQATDLVPALNKIWKQIGKLEPRILSDSGFQKVLAQTNKDLAAPIAAQLDTSKPTPVVRGPEIRVAAETPPLPSSQNGSAQMGLRSAQSSQPVPPPLGSRSFETPAKPATATPPPLGHRNFELTAGGATTSGEVPQPAPAAKRPAGDSTGSGPAPKLILTNSQWDARTNELNTLEKGLWGPYQQNQDKYNQALADATAVSDAAKAKFGTNSDFMRKFITSPDNKARTALLQDPQYAVKGSPLETAALNFMKYGDKTTSVLKWAVDHSVLAEAKKVADAPAAPTTTTTAVGQLEADAVKSEAAYNKTNKAQIDEQLRQELAATKAARLSGDDTGAIDHMRKADALILTMAAPAVNRRWLGEEYREQANAIDPLKDKDPQQAQTDLARKNDFSIHSQQQFQLAVQNSQLLNQDLLKQASDELATMMQRTVVGNQALTAEFGTMQGKIKGVGNDGSESMLDMTYQNAKTLATMQLESQHFEEAKQALATAIAYKKWTPETAPQNDPEYAQLASRIAAGLPENERGQIERQDNIYRRSWEELSGLAGYAIGATLFGKFMPASMKESYLGKAAAGTLAAGISGNVANRVMSGPRDSVGDAALNGIIAPVAIHGAMRLGGALAEGIAPKVGDSIFGEAVTKDKLVESIANRVGNGKLNAGQLYDYAQAQKISPETIGLHAPKDAAALARWRETPVFENGKVVYADADLLAGSKAQLNQVAGQMFSRPGKLVLPKQTMTKDEVIDWLKKNGRTDSALRLQTVDPGPGDEVIISKGKPIPALRPRLLGYDETEIAAAGKSVPADAPAVPKLTDAQAAEVLSDLPAPASKFARPASIARIPVTVGRSLVNTVRSGAGIRSIDILNDSPDVIANSLKWRAAYASPFVGNFAAFAETPVLQRLGKEVTGTESVKEANLTVGQLNAGAADLHVGSKQLLRQDLVADAAGNPITDNTMLIQNGERQPLFVKDKSGAVRPLAPDENILQTTKAQNARLLSDFVEKSGANKETRLIGRLAGAKGGGVYNVGDFKADLRKLDINPDNLSNAKLLNQLPDDTPLVIKGKVQKSAMVGGAKISLKPGFGISDAQASVVSGSLTPIEKSTLIWHKNEGIVKKAVNTVAPPIDMFGIKISGNPLWPELSSTGVFARAKGQLNYFNVLDASTKQIENQVGWNRMKSYVPAYILGAEAPLFGSTYLNSKYDATGQPLTPGQRFTLAKDALEVPSWAPATVKSADPSKASSLKDAFWETKDSDQKKWMSDFNDQVDRIYADQGHVTIRAFDDDGNGKLKVEGRIGGKQVFLIDKLRDRTMGLQDDVVEGLGAYTLWGGQQAFAASAIERTRILAPGFQAFVNNRLKPLTWLGTPWSDGYRSLTAPAAAIERQNTTDRFDWDGLVDQDYQDAINGKRPIQFDLPPDTKLTTSAPNNPGQQTPGTAQQIEAP